MVDGNLLTEDNLSIKVIKRELDLLLNKKREAVGVITKDLKKAERVLELVKKANGD